MVKSPLANAAPYLNVDPMTRKRMLAVKKQGTLPEVVVRRALHAMGYRFRLHKRNLPGTPDIVLPRHKKIVLVHGCFWHGHENCKKATLPKNNANTWALKIEANRARDERTISTLRELGWDVLVLWGCEVLRPEVLVRKLKEFLESSTPSEGRAGSH